MMMLLLYALAAPPKADESIIGQDCTFARVVSDTSVSLSVSFARDERLGRPFDFSFLIQRKNGAIDSVVWCHAIGTIQGG